VATPNIDRLAADGVLFKNHFSTGTVCSPSRGSIVTGCYPHTNGLMGLIHRGWELNVDKCPPLPQLLGDEGYQTHLFGFQHEHYEPSRLGYQQSHQNGQPLIDNVAPLLVDWLGTDEAQGRPFLAGIGFFEVHRLGLQPSHFKRDIYEPADPAEVEVRPYLPDIPEVREDLADFYGAVKCLDHWVGEILDVLEQAGLAENTVVIFTSDHGASFMHSKATVYDGGTKVPWIMRWPEGLDAGTVVESLSSHVDILPTLFDLMGLPIPEHVQGMSQAALANGEDGPARPYAFSEKNYTNFYDPSRAVRSSRFRYMRKGLQTCIFDFVIPEIELMPWGFREQRETFEFYSAKRCTEELYDHESDPGEMNNLAGDPEYAAALDEMRAVLDAHLAETGDPFAELRNDLPMHPTAYEAVRQRGRPSIDIK
jgi:N-sulfoglucosamine sulfohydrolase